MTPVLSESPLIETRTLTRVFGHGAETVRAVDGVSFAMQPGEIVAVVGESGSGKSTLARLLLRLLEPTSGQILLHGRDVTHIQRERELRVYWRQVQGVFQDPFASLNQFYAIGRVLGNALNLLDERLSNRARLERRDAALREAGLDPAATLSKWPHQLWGGQVPRVMLARALVVGPELLIADEPTSMLDASLRVTVLNVLRDLRDQHNMGIVFITHDLGQACYVSVRILAMYHGQLVEQGPVETVMANPQHAYTQQLLNDVPRLHAWGVKPVSPSTMVQDDPVYLPG